MIMFFTNYKPLGIENAGIRQMLTGHYDQSILANVKVII